MDWESVQNNICSLDLETNENGDIFAMAAVFQDQVFQCNAPFNIQQVLKEFDTFAEPAQFCHLAICINHKQFLQSKYY